MTGVIFSIIGLALGGLLKGATGAGAPIVAVPRPASPWEATVIPSTFAAFLSLILASRLRDEDDEYLLPALKLLRSRHLVVLASLREAIIARALSARVDSFERAVTHAAAAEYLSLRERSFRRIAAAGVLALDVEPERLPIVLVNRYLELKREGRL